MRCCRLTWCSTGWPNLHENGEVPRQVRRLGAESVLERSSVPPGGRPSLPHEPISSSFSHLSRKGEIWRGTPPMRDTTDHEHEGTGHLTWPTVTTRDLRTALSNWLVVDWALAAYAIFVAIVA